MTQWILAPSTRWPDEPHRSAGRFTIAWDSTHDGGQHHHLMQFHFGTGREMPDRHELLVRVICHLLVDRIPRQGLAELAECLGGMYRFYESQGAHTAQLPAPRITRGRTVRTETRPVPEFNEE